MAAFFVWRKPRFLQAVQLVIDIRRLVLLAKIKTSIAG